MASPPRRRGRPAVPARSPSPEAPAPLPAAAPPAAASPPEPAEALPTWSGLDPGTLGALAEQLHANPAFAAALDRVERDVLTAWRATEPEDTALRERHWMMLRTLTGLREALTALRMRQRRLSVAG